MEERDDLIPIELDDSKLREDTQTIIHQIVEEKEVDKIKDLTNLFNLNMAKKNALRVLKLNDLLDQVSDKMMERFEKRPEEFSHRDLIDYMNTVSTTIERAQKNLTQIEEIPQISYNQNNQININVVEEIPRESREKITDAISAIMVKLNQMQQDSFEVKEEQLIDNKLQEVILSGNEK